MTTKKCTKCGIVKPYNMFHKKTAFKDGLNCICKECILGHPIIIKTTIPGYKECCKCKTVLPISAFNNCTRSKDGLTSRCKCCIAIPIKEKRKIKAIERKEKEKQRILSLKSKICSSCNKELAVSEFPKYQKYKYRNECRLCYNSHCNRLRRKRNLKLDFNLSVEQYEDMVKAQKNKCAICGIHETELTYKLAVDHDHSTGNLRQLLCAKCNLLLGHANDSIEILKAAIKYLRSHRTN